MAWSLPVDNVVRLVTELARVAGQLALELDSWFDDVLAHLVAFSVAGDVEGALRCEPREVPSRP